MKKEDIILKKGDRVYYITYSGKNKSLIVDGYNGYTIKRFEESGGSKITKIERLETIYEAPKEILDKKEKEYLEAVLRPFRSSIKYVMKLSSNINREYLCVDIIDCSWFFPAFKKDTMYKGMDAHEKYTLAELGLFEGE